MRRLVAVLMSVILSGCASMVRGSPQQIRFESEPPGAQVVLEAAAPNKTWCQTPCTLTVPRSRQPVEYTIELGGHVPVDDELIPTSRWGAAAILVMLDFLLLVPGIIDLTGPAGYEFPVVVRATLPPDGQGQMSRVKVERAR